MDIDKIDRQINEITKDRYVKAIKEVIGNIDNVKDVKRIYNLVMYIYINKGDKK